MWIHRRTHRQAPPPHRPAVPGSSPDGGPVEPAWLRVAETAAAFATAVFHLVSQALGHQGEFILGGLLVWGGYIAVRAWRAPRILRAWGLTSGGLRDAWTATLPFALPVCLAIVLAAVVLQRPLPPLHALIVILLYPVWGLIQQLLVQGFLVRHTDHWLRGKHRIFTTLLAAVAFSLVHLPEFRLVLATFAMGMAFTAIWLSYRNLLPLALWHGVLGALYYYLVLARDPWLEQFGPGGAGAGL